MDLIEVSEVMMRLWGGGGIIADASVSLQKLGGQQQPSDGFTKNVETCTAELLPSLSGLPGNRHMEINFCRMYPLLRLCQLKSHAS